MTKLKIMAVDDQPANLQMIIEVLKHDYAVIPVTSGKKALQLAEKSSPISVILLDVLMPEMDGFEVIEKLKANPDTASIPVIFVTGRGEESDFAKGLGLGAFDFVGKPISPSLLKQRIAHCIAATP